MLARLLLSLLLVLLGAGLFMAIFLNLRRPPQDAPFNLFLIQSGSMAPTINIGDLVLTVKKDNYVTAEVITFRDKEARTVTHRVQTSLFRGGQFHYITKGDAAAAADLAEVSTTDVYGNVRLVIPVVGLVLPFVQSPFGFTLMIVAPGLILLGLYFADFFRQ